MTIDVERLKEALEDHWCASDAILGKNIDVLASAAQTLLRLLETNPDVLKLLKGGYWIAPDEPAAAIAKMTVKYLKELTINDEPMNLLRNSTGGDNDPA